MVQVNFARREINFNITLYGPGLSGKTTNIERIHQNTPAEYRKDLVSIATEGDRTLLFGYNHEKNPLLGGMKSIFIVKTVPGQVFYNSTRRLILSGVDAVIFVADSQKAKMSENKDSLMNLKENLESHGLKISDIPLVMQWNKRDLAEIATLEELERELNPDKFPSFEAVAIAGKGVENCLDKAIAMCAEKFQTTQGKTLPKANSLGKFSHAPAKMPPKPDFKPTSEESPEIESLLKGESILEQELELLDLSGRKFTKEIFLRDVTIQCLRAKETSFLQKVHWKNVTIDTLDMGDGNCRFEKDFMLEGVTIHKNANWDHVKFQGAVTLQSFTMPKNTHDTDEQFVSFHSAQFADGFTLNDSKLQGLDIRGAQFGNKTKIWNSVFDGDVNFGLVSTKCGAVFKNELEIRGCMFKQRARFRDCRFGKKVSILDCKFEEQAFFGEAQFAGQALFFGTTFCREAHFHLATFAEEVNFSDTKVLGNTMWIKTRFIGRLFARNSQLGKLEMERAKCEQGADFNQASCDQSDLSYAIFSQPVTFNSMNFGGNCCLRSTLFEKKVNFYGAQFNGKLVLSRMDAEKIHITWPQVKGKLLSESKKDYIQSAEEFSLLKKIFDSQNRYEDLDEAYYCYKKSRRKNLKFSLLSPGDSLKRIIDFWILDLGCGYGTRPFRITFSSFALILLFALIYALFPTHFVYNGPQGNVEVLTWSNAIYFSIATFTTMGFGDWAPAPHSLFRFLVTIEVFIGIFTMALFVGAFTRKVMR